MVSRFTLNHFSHEWYMPITPTMQVDILYNIPNTFNYTFLNILTIDLCTSSCDTQLTDAQYQLCCDPINYGNTIQVMTENHRTAYLVCPLKAADWCI